MQCCSWQNNCPNFIQRIQSMHSSRLFPLLSPLGVLIRWCISGSKADGSCAVMPCANCHAMRTHAMRQRSHACACMRTLCGKHCSHNPGPAHGHMGLQPLLPLRCLTYSTERARTHGAHGTHNPEPAPMPNCQWQALRTHARRLLDKVPSSGPCTYPRTHLSNLDVALRAEHALTLPTGTAKHLPW